MFGKRLCTLVSLMTWVIFVASKCMATHADHLHLPAEVIAHCTWFGGLLFHEARGDAGVSNNTCMCLESFGGSKCHVPQLGCS